jgi:hypothetical protein
MKLRTLYEIMQKSFQPSSVSSIQLHGFLIITSFIDFFIRYRFRNLTHPDNQTLHTENSSRDRSTLLFPSGDGSPMHFGQRSANPPLQRPYKYARIEDRHTFARRNLLPLHHRPARMIGRLLVSSHFVLPRPTSSFFHPCNTRNVKSIIFKMRP